MALFRCGGGAAEDTYAIGYAAIAQNQSTTFTTTRDYKKFRVAWQNASGKITINGVVYNAQEGTELYSDTTQYHALYEEFDVAIPSGTTITYTYTGGGSLATWIFGIA